MRHAIQRWGHDVLPVLFTVAAFGSTLLFFLGNQYQGTPPKLIIVPVVMLMAFCIEFATFTILQDLQDAITVRDTPGLIRSGLFSAAVLAASIFMMANASADLWAPRDMLLGIPARTWSWIMAGLFFGVQLALKLTPERPRSQRSLTALAGMITLMAPDATPEQQAVLAARMLNAFAGVSAGQPDTALPEPGRAPPALPKGATGKAQAITGQFQTLDASAGPESEDASSGNGKGPFRRKRANP
jgi:hypothetical protein